jgi:hypothetical protein
MKQGGLDKLRAKIAAGFKKATDEKMAPKQAPKAKMSAPAPMKSIDAIRKMVKAKGIY